MPPKDQNENLIDELVDDEGPAILAWIVAGAVDVIANGLPEPECVMAATEEYTESPGETGAPDRGPNV